VPQQFAAGAGGATTLKTCVCAANLQPNHWFFENKFPRGVPCLCADKAVNMFSVHLVQAAQQCAAGVGGATTAKACACAAKSQTCLCLDEANNS
jgi:hypothetical protein